MPNTTNVIHQKSCVNMDEIESNSIRLIVTSPPYFNVKDYGTDDQIGLSSPSYDDYIDSMIPIWKECFRVLKPNGKLCINSPCMPMPKSVVNTHYNRDIFNINNDIEFSILQNTAFFRYGVHIWDKGLTSQLMMGSYPYPPNLYVLNNIEFINIFVKDGEPEKISQEIKDKSKISKDDWYEGIQSIWKITPQKNSKHPAPFPIELPSRLIRLFSFFGDSILDPFMGSGTTALAAKKLGRDYIGYELNSDYIKLAHDRLSQGILLFDN
jgi:site-specific DNA-methyltransferase (cytosine-N4-specific)